MEINHKKRENNQNCNIILTHVPHGCLLLTRSRQTLVHELSLYEAHPPLWREKTNKKTFW